VNSRISRRFTNGLRVVRLLPSYIVFGGLKHLVNLPQLAQWAWRSPATPHDREAARKLVAGVARLSTLIGMGDRDCLQRSLLLYRVLSRAGADPILVVGFYRNADQVLGHAWVIVDGRAIIDRELDVRLFTPMFCFGRDGALLAMQPDPSFAGGLIRA